MDLPDKFLNIARARASMVLDRKWAEIEEYASEIDRLFLYGPQEGDEDLICNLAKLVAMELFWRMANRCRAAQGEVDKEIE